MSQNNHIPVVGQVTRHKVVHHATAIRTLNGMPFAVTICWKNFVGDFEVTDEATTCGACLEV